ncbi:NEL-type E3 ubiquitin ligase domain-containing protein [Candidatus Rhabdochlamydia porcellionis]|uniref:E3 ubiquitin-protein ligase SspH2 n=1 Tax=Candidatus Rhabdochlamydia porcellionis TaxID=225148 RepID=A0ABX8Z372_9BACT|nr:NEL-type E3 ubiquitin ligase domain-containing protein [Candidatus Rhabdochlamydia porcellionis]QZA58997.1 E3 ubiquitin-protein ligase SspH2 [Candidatus Rhabdochlamydia porcellionis]
MLTRSINKFLQQSFLIMSFKSVRSIDLFSLVALAFPCFSINYKYSGFSIRKIIDIWDKNKAATVVKIRWITSKLNLHNASFEAVLDQWVKGASGLEFPSRIEARRRILNFFVSSQEKKCLSLYNLRLTSLPDVFRFTLFSNNLEHFGELPRFFNQLQALTHLNLASNQLSSLPECIGSLKSLANLDLSDNQISYLPECIGSLKSLANLDLSDNQIRELPKSFGQLQALVYLDLESNQLSSLPECIGGLKSLAGLDLSDNQIRELPRSLNQLQALTHLHLGSNQLSSLPECIGGLESLIDLDLSDNQIRELPRSLNQLQALTHLHLGSNQLSSLPGFIGDLQTLISLDLSDNLDLSELPDQMLGLSSDCIITFTIDELSQETLEGIYETVSDPEYRGPFLRILSRERSIKESLIELYQITGRSPIEFSLLEETEELRSWLHRLFTTANFQKGGVLQKEFANKIISCLNQANKNKEFYEVFFTLIQDATGTCGDRIALSVLHLDIAHKIANIALEKMKELADFLIKGPWTIKILEEIARDKVSASSALDEIEVYLGYPVQLREKLEIPIDITEMLFFSCSGLSPEDLSNAEEHVLKKRENKEECFTFLVDNDKWIEALKNRYPTEFEAAQKKRTECTGGESEQDVIAGDKFKEKLVELTKKALE